MDSSGSLWKSNCLHAALTLNSSHCIWYWFSIYIMCLFICDLLVLRSRLLCESFMTIEDNLFVNLGRLSTLWNDICNGFEATKHCMVTNIHNCSPMFSSHFQHHLDNYIYPNHRTFLSTVSRFFTIASTVCSPIVGTSNFRNFWPLDWSGDCLIWLAITNHRDCPFKFSNQIWGAKVIKGTYRLSFSLR